jgi:MoaA/NifB/PqqE/SkfB family radical SAM enzyme
VRDNNYVPWLFSLGVRAAQLTIFGDEETTDFIVGRKGAFNEVLQTIDILLANRIAPCIQFFIYKSNISKLPYVQQLIETLDLEKKCVGFDKGFSFFLHQGSCSGENEQFYDVWITPEDVEKIPPKLRDFTIKHFNTQTIEEVLGETEQLLCNRLIYDNSNMSSIVTDKPVFFVDKDFNVYPNYETPSPLWVLGNLQTDSADKILTAYANNESIAQHTMITTSISKMVQKHGNPDSMRLFGEWDYKNYLLLKYLRDK